MHERLVENWLDNVNERSLQTPFCQILVAKGHKIIHSSRHCAAEYGKDVITVDPDGNTCAFQLKGHPGSRLTLSEWRKISSQVHDLVHIRIPDQLLAASQHKSYLVTNGLVEEEVMIAIDMLNSAMIRDGHPSRVLEVIQRGSLLADFLTLGVSLWPTELTRVNDFLSMIVMDEGALPPVDRIHRILRETLLLDSQERVSSPEAKRRVHAVSLLVHIALSPFHRGDNHSSVIHGLIQSIAYIIACCEKNQLAFDDIARETVKLLRGEIVVCIEKLLDETEAMESLTVGDPQTDFLFFRPRISLLLGLFGAYWLGGADPEKKRRIDAFSEKYKHKIVLWGEGALPSLIIHYYHLCHSKRSRYAETFLLKLVAAVFLTNKQFEPWRASPYYTVEDVLREILPSFLKSKNGALQDETLGKRSFFSRTLFFLLARTGRKQHCKAMWPAFTQIESTDFLPSSKSAFCMWRTDEGTETHVQQPDQITWVQLKEALAAENEEYIPSPMLDDPFLIAVFTIFFPYRMTYDVSRAMDRRIGFFRFYT